MVSPTVAPRGHGPIFRRGGASTLWVPSAPRSATLQAGRRIGDWRSAVHSILQKMLHIFVEGTEIFRVGLVSLHSEVGGENFGGRKFRSLFPSC